MRNVTILILAFFVVSILFVSCGDKKTPDKPPEPFSQHEKKQSIEKVNPFKPINEFSSRESERKESPHESKKMDPIHNPQKIDGLMGEARQAFSTENYKIAIEKLEEAIKIAENINVFNPKAYLMAGEIYQIKKDYKNAALNYEKYLENPDDEKLKALESICKIYYDWGMLYNKLFETSLNLNLDYYTYKLETPGAGQKDILRYFRGLNYFSSQQWDKAISDFESVGNQLKSYNILAKVKLAACHYKKGNKKVAEQIWSTIKNTDDPMIASELFRTYLEAGKYFDDKEFSTQLNKMSQGLDNAKALKNDYNKIRANMVSIYSIKGELGKTLSLFSIDDLRYPEFKIAKSKFYENSLFYHIASVYFHKAKEYCQECIKIAPQNTHRYNYIIGLCQMNARDLDDAISSFSKVSSEPLKTRAEINIARCLYGKGETQKASQIWYRVSQDSIKNNDSNTLGEISRLYARLGINLQDAKDFSIRSKDPIKLAYVYNSLGLVAKDQEERISYFTEASQLFNKSRQRLDYRVEFNDPVILIDLANTYYHRRVFDESAKIWRYILDEYPEAYQIYDIIQLINEIQQMQKSKGFESNWVNFIS